jgi:hypothetical protein
MTARSNHRQLWSRFGAPEHPTDRRLTVVFPGVPGEGQSLSSRSTRPDYIIDRETGCWNWNKFMVRGYGIVSLDGTGRRAARVYYEAAYGPIPGGSSTHVHHRCENPACVNPEHLELTLHGPHLAYHKQEASTLTWDDVHAIRDAIRQGERQRDVCARYGIAQPTLSDIVTGTTWKDATYVPGRPAKCAWCSADFVAARANQRYCCRSHSYAFNNDKARRAA